jgi:hypothetical protein
VEDFIVQLTGKTLADHADIDIIKAAFVRAKIFNEQIKMTGKSQLNFLIDSYNMIYELPKHKNY